MAVDSAMPNSAAIAFQALPAAHAGDPVPQLVAGRGALIERARRVNERHRLVELEAVLLLAADFEAELFALGGIASEQALANGAREDLREQVQVRVDGLRLQRLQRTAAAVGQGFADRQGSLDPAVLGELAIEVGLDVAARQLAHGDVAEMRQQMDLELALDVGQAARTQGLADLPLVMLFGELRDRRDVALDAVGLQRRAPSSREDLSGDQPCLVLGTRACHALVAAPETNRLGRVAAAPESHAVAHDAVAVGVLADLPCRLAGHMAQVARGEGVRATRRSMSRL